MPPPPCLPQKEDRVGIWAPNCVEWCVLQASSAQARRAVRAEQRGFRKGPSWYQQQGCALYS